jgi:DNA segregation ATPase FtsK/SpoIIIE-like protein
MRKDVPIEKLHANPFRRIEQYPIQEEKVEALVESIEQTGFWNNLVCREAEDHGYQIAYGHHRLEALFRFADKVDERITVNVEVKDLSDKEMLKIMARENMEEWGSDAWIDLETVRSTVEAYADERINIEQPSQKTNRRHLRFAPSFIKGGARRPSDEQPYTASTIASFLGWEKPSGQPQGKVKYALKALELIEQDIIEERAVKGMNTTELRALVTKTQKRLTQEKEAAESLKEEAEEAKQQAEEASDPHEKQAAKNRKRDLEKKAEQHERRAKEQAKEQAEEVSEQFQNDEKGAKEVLREDSTPEAPEPDQEDPADKRVRANEILDTITMQVGNTLAEGSKLREKVDELGRLVDEGFLREEQVEDVVSVLRMLSDRADSLADDLEHREVEYEVSLS